MSDEAAGQQVAENTAHGLTCNLDGIPSQERARYTELLGLLRHAIRDKRELSDGYAFFWTRLNLLWIKHSSGPSSNESAAHSSRCKFAGIWRTGQSANHVAADEQRVERLPLRVIGFCYLSHKATAHDGTARPSQRRVLYFLAFSKVSSAVSLLFGVAFKT
jgi:hypothetical protein